MWRSGNRRLEVWKLITLISELLYTLIACSLPTGFEETRLNMNQVRGDWNRPSDHINSATRSHEYVCWFLEREKSGACPCLILIINNFHARYFQSGELKHICRPHLPKFADITVVLRAEIHLLLTTCSRDGCFTYPAYISCDATHLQAAICTRTVGAV